MMPFILWVGFLGSAVTQYLLYDQWTEQSEDINTNTRSSYLAHVPLTTLCYSGHDRATSPLQDLSPSHGLTGMGSIIQIPQEGRPNTDPIYIVLSVDRSVCVS